MNWSTFFRGRETGLGSNSRRAVILSIGVGVTALVLANVHLVYVAVTSRPDCVAHLKERGDPAVGAFRAARPSC
ncbi:hypothetical protein [Hansschlegelia zhihuaiae]|uniref:Uncharacterized protein n=1 Tax=Hansschlegelia zhihuaiae TaxID=405005 RepID=A0A4Q0MDB0_9HYPH|nr:hypothetical protein [Hansschlegelia zhihuaiae]RXF70909.1 hypothetical protein EK403_15985 [Hansschlegelia zhihuaiae]